jgi:hypothetical protein
LAVTGTTLQIVQYIIRVDLSERHEAYAKPCSKWLRNAERVIADVNNAMRDQVGFDAEELSEHMHRPSRGSAVQPAVRVENYALRRTAMF